MTREDLRKTFPDATEEQISAILNIHSADIGVALGKQKANIDDLQGKLSTAENKLKAFDGVDLDGLNKKLKKYEDDEKSRKEAEEKAANEKALYDRFDKLSGERKYLNDYTRNGIFSEFKTELDKSENKGKSDSDIFLAITKDREGIFTNPNLPGMIPPVGGSSKDDIAAIRTAMGLK